MPNDCLLRNNVTIGGNADASDTLLFVHGLGTDQSAWSAVAAAFAGDFRQILFDNVGATAANRAYFLEHQSHYLDIAGYADDLLGIAAALDLTTPVTLVGHSLGGMVCLMAAARQPDWFDKIVLIGASPCYLNVGSYRGGMDRENVEALYRVMNENYLGWTAGFAPLAIGDPEKPGLIRLFEHALAAIPPAMMLTVMCSILQGDHREMLKSVRHKALVIQSRQDFMVPLEVAGFLHQHLAGSCLEVIEASGHLPHLSAPDPVIQAMRRFLG